MNDTGITVGLDGPDISLAEHDFTLGYELHIDHTRRRAYWWNISGIPMHLSIRYETALRVAKIFRHKFGNQIMEERPARPEPDPLLTIAELREQFPWLTDRIVNRIYSASTGKYATIRSVKEGTTRRFRLDAALRDKLARWQAELDGQQHLAKLDEKLDEDRKAPAKPEPKGGDGPPDKASDKVPKKTPPESETERFAQVKKKPESLQEDAAKRKAELENSDVSDWKPDTSGSLADVPRDYEDLSDATVLIRMRYSPTREARLVTLPETDDLVLHFDRLRDELQQVKLKQRVLRKARWRLQAAVWIARLLA